MQLDEQERRRRMVEYGLKNNIARMQRDLERYHIHYDRWFHETELHESGYVRDTVELLTQKGMTYEKDGAIWLRSTDFGCEKDDVLRRANGFYTYFAADIAYHRNKLEVRGFDRAITSGAPTTTAMSSACSARWTRWAWTAATGWRSCSCSWCA